MTVKKAEVVPKKWGHELIIENNDKYCGKVLHFEDKCKFSMHFHAEKDETWYVLRGVFELIVIEVPLTVAET